MAPLISIIMTVYNSMQYLQESIKSILSQSFKEYELIIVDDGSEDELAREIISFSDPRIHFHKIDHIGRANALNYALSLSKCELVAFMDADDISCPNRIQKQYDYLVNHKEVGVVSGWYFQMTKEGNIKSIKKHPEQHSAIERKMTEYCSSCFPAAIIRKSLIEKIGGFDKELKGAIDYSLFIKLLPLTTFYNIQEPLIYHRNHENSISALYNKEQKLFTLKLATSYLSEQLEQASSKNKKYDILMRLGIAEYYNGCMKNARRLLFDALYMKWYNVKIWRYIFPTFLGNRFFIFYRKLVNHG